MWNFHSDRGLYVFWMVVSVNCSILQTSKACYVVPLTRKCWFSEFWSSVFQVLKSELNFVVYENSLNKLSMVSIEDVLKNLLHCKWKNKINYDGNYKMVKLGVNYSVVSVCV